MTRSNPWLPGAVIALAGFGRGANGSAGPFAPAEQAWLAEVSGQRDRGFVFSLNTAQGFLGMTIGELASALLSLWRGSLGSSGRYRPLFGIVILGNAVHLWLIARTPEKGWRVRTAEPSSANHPRSEPTRALENRFLLFLFGLNTLNGLAVGLTCPFISCWFSVRSHVG